MKAKILILFILMAFGLNTKAVDYYFSSSTGDDARTSTQAQNPATPWKTLSKLNSFFPSLQPGDNVFFKGGETFYGSLITTKAGTSSLPITLGSYGTGKATISGFTNVTSWTSAGGGVYESNVLPSASTVNMVVINGQQYAMGRYPNATATNGGYLTFESHGTNSITDNQSTINNSWTGSQLAVRTLFEAIETSTITGISGKTISYSPAFQNTPVNNFGYFIQNSLKTLDQFGEWYYNSSTHKLSVYFGATPTATVQVSSIDNLITVHSSYLTLNNLTLSGANSNAIFADWQGISNLKVSNCNIYFSGIDAGAFAGMTDLKIDSSLIQNSNSNGIDLFYNNVNPVITNTTINNTATFNGMMKKDAGSKYGLAIYASSGLTALKNTIYNSGYMGIYFIGNNVLVQNNFIQRFGTTLGDGGGIYSWVGTGNQTYTNRKIIANIVLDGIGAKEGTYNSDPAYNPVFGIYLDDNCNNIEITGNTVANCASDGVYVHNSTTSSFVSNVLYNNTRAQFYIQHDVANDISGLSMKFNQLFAKASTQLVHRWASPNNNFSTYGSIDSNYLCRPIAENTINFTNWFSNLSRYYTLAEWQSILGHDLHSKKSPFTIPDVANILFDYNPTSSNKVITFTGTYVGLNSVQYNGSATIPPYSSLILLKQ